MSRPRPKRNSVKVTNYAEPVIAALPLKPKLNTKDIILSPPFKTYWQLQRQQKLKFKIQDEYEFYPLIIKKFQVENNIKYIFCDIITRDGIGYDTPVRKEEVHYEYWISSIIGYEQALCDIITLVRYKTHVEFLPHKFCSFKLFPI